MQPQNIKRKTKNGAACVIKRQAVDKLLPIRSFATCQRERKHLASHQSYLALHFNLENVKGEAKYLRKQVSDTRLDQVLRWKADERARKAHSCLFTSSY